MERRVVLSASRMTDMPKYYSLDLIREIDKRKEKGRKIHTLVLWTKHPGALLKNPLHRYLEQLKKEGVQLYIQLSITGMGQRVVGAKPDGTPLILEPKAPTTKEAINSLPEVIRLVEKPQRIRLRIDPIVRIKDHQGHLFSSLPFFTHILDSASELGVETFSFSFLEKGVHRKVDNRMALLGCEIIPPTDREREKMLEWIKDLEKKHRARIHPCCVRQMPVSRCIDGEELMRLHEERAPVSLKQPKKRKLCGCTESIDLGGWPPKKCHTGCLYCYANSVIN
jgi:DNA repair photolyase